MPNSLRLTLRTLLSYLDDTLDPAQAKAIGQKVAESEQARELMERIKQVTRRRRLTTPPAAGPGGIDANTIAEYLDNEVTPEQAAEVEQICLASDVHLAEVAACHQILTLVLGEPALVPPSARQRMYGLVKGPEAIPFRKPPRGGTQRDLDLSTSDAAHELEESRGAVAASGMRNSLLLAGAGLVVVLMLVFIFWNIFRPRPDGGGDSKDTRIVAADSAKDKDKDDKKDITTDKKAAQEDRKGSDDKKDATETKKDGADEKKDTVEDKKKGPEPKGLTGNEEIPFDPPDTKPVVLGRYIPNAKAPDVLLARGPSEKASWDRLWVTNSDIASPRSLLALPGMRSEVELKKGVHLVMWGTLPEIWPNPLIYESMVELHSHPQLDLDLTLRRGRILLASDKPAGKPAVVRVRFDNPTQQKKAYFDITLKGDGAAVAIERMCSIPQNEPFFEDRKHPNRKGPYAEMYCFFLAGHDHIRSSDLAFAVDADREPQMVIWSSLAGLKEAVPYTPDWLSAKPKLGDAKQRTKAQEAALMLARNVQGKKLDIALQEALLAASAAPEKDAVVNPATPMLALRCDTALDEITVPLEVLDQDNVPDFLRRTAIYSLRYWIAQERDNDYRLYDALRERQRNIVARKVMELLHGITTAEMGHPATWQRLIDDLDNSVMALRELSAWNLEVLVPTAAKKINDNPNPRYSASAPQEQRRATMAAWRTFIPPGRVPEPPKKQ